MKKTLLFLLALPLAADERLLSTLWTQTASEYRGAALQAYRSATVMLDRALADVTWTAALEQKPPFGKLPPAVILDADETVLDKSPFQARLIRAGAEFLQPAWDAWVAESAAQPVPGAAEFCRYAASKGVTVFYVTNREAKQEAATRDNLRALQFPLSDKVDTLLLRAEKPEWTSDKSSRRADVARRYRVLLLVGDDLGDFLSGVRVSVEARQALASPQDRYWGTRWIILPNPMYGSWEDALFGHDRTLSREEKLRRKLESLRIAP